MSGPLGTKELFDTMLWACERGDAEMLKRRRDEFLLCDKNFRKCIDQNGDTILHKSVQKDTTCLKFCLQRISSVDANRVNVLGKTPLHLAVKSNLIECAQLLLDHGASVEVFNNVGSTPLHTAASCGSVECLQLLLKRPGVDVNMKDANGNTILHKCAYDACVRVADVAISGGGKVNAMNTNHQTPLHIAAKRKTTSSSKSTHMEFIHVLMENDADVNAMDNQNNTPLHFAASRCFHELFLLLIERGANVNAQNKEQNTPLHLAAQNLRPDSKEWEEFIFDLIRHGADVNVKNQFGKTPVELCGRNSTYMFEGEHLRAEDEKRKKKNEEEEAQKKLYEDKRLQDLEERKKKKEERELFVQKEAERRRVEELEQRRAEEEEKQQQAEEEERRRLEEEAAKKNRKRKSKKGSPAASPGKR